MNILIMDDDEGQRNSIQMFLHTQKHDAVAPEFYGADEGHEAMLAEIEQKAFDVIIFDLNWDNGYNKDGAAAAQLVREMYETNNQKPPVFLLSSANTQSLSVGELRMFDGILKEKGSSGAMKELRDSLQLIADGNLEKLGESVKAAIASQKPPKPTQG